MTLNHNLYKVMFWEQCPWISVTTWVCAFVCFLHSLFTRWKLSNVIWR